VALSTTRFSNGGARVGGSVLALALVVSTLTVGCGAERERTIRVDRSDLPLLGASATETARFAAGDGLFEAVFRAPDGLGPLYIRSSCEACHAADGRGPGLVAKMSVAALGAGSTPARSPLPFGNTQRPYVSGGGRTPLGAPAEIAGRLRVSYRLPPAVWGRGYLEAVSDGEIERLAAMAATRPGPIKGRIHRVRCASEASGAAGGPVPPHGAGHRPGAAGLIGRFGLKARIATLDEFAADALQSDMGLTSPLRPRELPNPDGLADDGRPGMDVDWDMVQALGDYVRLIEIPRPPATADGIVAGARGRLIFERAQCATCHVPELRTRPDYPVPALAGITAPVYTDFLLHDMGTALADGVVDGDAGPREWRTAPLMGLRFMPAFLHDGRARTIEEAVAAHEGPGSEGNGAVAAFRALAPSDRDEVVAFVRGL
jgi:CxxC motif-containing protein (DUF1111 family)